MAGKSPRPGPGPAMGRRASLRPPVVQDEGPGVPAAEVLQHLESFYRGRGTTAFLTFPREHLEEPEKISASDPVLENNGQMFKNRAKMNKTWKI